MGICFTIPYIIAYKLTARISRRPPPPKFSPQIEENLQDLRISQPLFFRFDMAIYFVARNKASMRRFNRRSGSIDGQPSVFGRSTARLPLTVLPTAPSDCHLHNDETRLSVRPCGRRTFVAWPLARLLLPGRCSIVCLPVGRPSSVCSSGSCSAVHHPSAGRPRCPYLPSTAHRPFAGTRSFFRFPPRCSCYRLSVVPTVSHWCQQRTPKHVLSYENGGCEFAERFPYEVCSSGPSRSKLISFGFNLAYG